MKHQNIFGQNLKAFFKQNEKKRENFGKSYT
jgi:hypothetical protein